MDKALEKLENLEKLREMSVVFTKIIRTNITKNIFSFELPENNNTELSSDEIFIGYDENLNSITLDVSMNNSILICGHTSPGRDKMLKKIVDKLSTKEDIRMYFIDTVDNPVYYKYKNLNNSKYISVDGKDSFIKANCMIKEIENSLSNRVNINLNYIKESYYSKLNLEIFKSLPYIVLFISNDFFNLLSRCKSNNNMDQNLISDANKSFETIKQIPSIGRSNNILLVQITNEQFYRVKDNNIITDVILPID